MGSGMRVIVDLRHPGVNRLAGDTMAGDLFSQEWILDTTVSKLQFTSLDLSCAMTTGLRSFFRLIGMLACLVGMEGISWFSLRMLAKFGMVYRPIATGRLLDEDRRAVEQLLTDDSTYLVHSAGLGWSIRPGGVSPEALYRANSQGMRADQTYSTVPPDGFTRISTYGDSFVHGDEVALEETWQAELVRLNPRLEALNFGVPAYGPDQSLLRYREESARCRSHIVLIGFMSENIQRTVNVFRAFYQPGSGMPFAKPRFVQEPSGLRLLGNPFPTLAHYRALLEDSSATLRFLSRNDEWFELMPHESALDIFATVRLIKTFLFWYRRVLCPSAMLSPAGVYRRESEPFRLTRAVLSTFYGEVEMRGEFPVIVLFPSPMDVLRYRKSGKARYAPLVEDLRGMDLRVIDPMEELAMVTHEAEEGTVNVHYSAAQNKVVAGKIFDELSHRWPDALEKWR